MNFNISVVIPVYNAEKFLRRAIESVLIQSEVTELILAEDGSRDNSLGICLQMQALNKRIIVLQHEAGKNKGVSATRNLGIKNAKNSFIAFLDADDYYLTDRFKQTKECFDADNTIDGVYEMIGIHSGSTDIKFYSLIEAVKPGVLFENLQPIGNKVWFSIDGLTVKKIIFEKSGYFAESLKTSEDTLQWFKFAATSKLIAGNINQPVALSEKLLNGLSSNGKETDKDFVLMLFKLFEWCKKANCSGSRKEMVLNVLFFHAFNTPNQKAFKGSNKVYLLLQLIITDPGYILLRSTIFRRYLGNLIGYNNARRFLNKKKLS